MCLGVRRAHVLGSIHDLPPLNAVARHLIGLLGDDRVSAADLDHVIRNDQALTARVLKHANSSVYGKSRRVASLTEAVVLLGDDRLSELVIGTAVAEAMGETGLPGFALHAWDHAVDCAAAARAVARLGGGADPDTAFVAGLLHDIGLLVMARAEPAAMAAVLARRPADPLAAERAEMGVNHAQAGQRVLEAWNLPPALCEAVRLHHAPHRKHRLSNPLVNITALGDLLTLVDGAVLYPDASRPDPFALLKLCGVDQDTVPALFAELARSRLEARRLLAAVRGTADDRVAAPAPAGDDRPVYAVWAQDPLRRAWYTCALRHHGQDVVEAAGAGGRPGWLLADLHGASPDVRERVARLAALHGLLPALFGTVVATTGPWREAPRLSPVPRAADLSALAGMLEVALA